MTNTPIAELIAEHLPQLVHPGDDTHEPTPIPLPMFRTSAIPPEMAKQFADDAGLPSPDVAKLTSEAIVAVIEADHEIVPKAELAQLRANAQSGVERHRQPRIHCGCGQFLFSLNIDTEKPTVDGGQLIKALSGMNPTCPHEAP